MTSPAEILAGYKSGLYTGLETQSRLVALAANHDPAEYLPEIPARWVEAIRLMDGVKTPPVKVEEVLVLSGRLYRRDIDASAAIKLEQQQIFKALWAMHRYFYGGDGPNEAPDAGDA